MLIFFGSSCEHHGLITGIASFLDDERCGYHCSGYADNRGNYGSFHEFACLAYRLATSLLLQCLVINR
jgi:hypothetical protein